MLNYVRNIMDNKGSIVNVFLGEDEINFTGIGQLATLEDLEILCSDSQITNSKYIQLADGIYIYMSRETNLEILRGYLTKSEEMEVRGAYCKISDSVPEVYKQFIKDIDEDEEVLSMNFNEYGLSAMTRINNGQIVYIYNYSNTPHGIDKNTTIVPIDMIKSVYDQIVDTQGVA